ncbi:MAG: hypothetical protein H7039_21265 [Bryobacteraceae bacterium]|nr:hypothetical protein [Bryobacteraceae bacterium]
MEHGPNQSEERSAEVKRPRNSFSSRVDEKGRLKLPAEIDRYLRSLLAVDVYITSFDGRSARIYSSTEWEKQEALLEAPGEHADWGETLLRRARAYGSDTSIDNQGRVLMPNRLRRAMDVENQAVMLTCMKGHVEVLSEAVFEEKLAPEADTSTMLRHFAQMGLR